MHVFVYSWNYTFMADSPPTNRNGDFITGQIGTAVVAWLCSIEW